MSVLFAFLHHVAAFTLVAAIALEFVLLRDELTLWSVRRLQVAGMILGIAAGVLLIVGLARVVWFEKGAAYYFANHAFLTKCFRSCRPSNSCPGATHLLVLVQPIRNGQVPAVAAERLKRVRMIVHVELAAIVLIVLCAAIMAKGGWV